MDDEAWIFVVAADYGLEGHSEPFQAFRNRDEAFALCKQLQAEGYSPHEVYKVPIWPNILANIFNIKPEEQ